MSVLVLVEVLAKPECKAQLIESLKRGLPRTREAEGCESIHTYLGEDGRTVVAVEHWESKEHYERYLAWRVETGVMDALGALLESPPQIRFFSALDA